MMAKVGELKGDMENTTVIISNKHQEEEKGEIERSWSELQPELLCSIVKHLRGWDCNTFRSICRSWRSIPPVIWSPPPSNDSPLFQGPCLLSYNENNHSWKFFHPLLCNATCHMDISEVSNITIHFSKYGWLLMQQGKHALFFFNPITKVKIKLPDIPGENILFTFCFSAPPTSPDCVIVGFMSIDDKWINIGMLKHGEKSWTMFNDCYSYQRFTLSICNPVMYNGVFYCLGVRGNIGIFDPNNEESVWTIIADPIRYVRNCQQSYLVESDGDLIAVHFPNDGRQVYLLKLDLSKMAWEWLQCLGNKMLYVSHGTSFAKTAVVKGTGDKIFLPRLYDNHCVFYSLATRKYHTFLGSYCSGDLLDEKVKKYKHCTWIEPMLTNHNNF